MADPHEREQPFLKLREFHVSHVQIAVSDHLKELHRVRDGHDDGEEEHLQLANIDQLRV